MTTFYFVVEGKHPFVETINHSAETVSALAEACGDERITESTCFLSLDLANERFAAVALPAAAGDAILKITQAATVFRSKLLGGDITKMGEYNVKDRAAGMENRDTARLLASAEAAARGVTPDELLETWAEKSAQLGLDVTMLAARAVSANKKITEAKSIEEIDAIVEEFTNV